MTKVKNTYQLVRFYNIHNEYGFVPAVGDALFLGGFRGQGEAECTHAWTEPLRTNSSHEIRVGGWCGTNNGVATYARGAGMVTAVLSERDGYDSRWGHEGDFPEPYVSLRVRVLSDEDTIALRDEHR